jgi:hypothetical protein
MNIEELSALLQQAADSGIAQSVQQSGFVNKYIERTLTQFVTVNEPINKLLLEWVAKQPELEVFNNKSFNQGATWSLVTYEFLVKWMLFNTKTQGIDPTIDILVRYVSLLFNPATEVLAITGITVTKTIQLTPTIFLVPFSSVPTSHARDALDPEILKPEVLAKLGYFELLSRGHLHKPPTAALLRKIRLTPKSIDSGEPIARPPSADELYEVCECLTLIGKCTPLPIAHWHSVDEWVPCSGMLASGWSSPIQDVINSHTTEVAGDLEVKAAFQCEKFMNLPQPIRDRLRVPIQRLNQARRRKHIADKAIDLGVAFESLYLNDRSHKEQISFTFRLRAAWHLGSDQSERERLLETL